MRRSPNSDSAQTFMRSLYNAGVTHPFYLGIVASIALPFAVVLLSQRNGFQDLFHLVFLP